MTGRNLSDGHHLQNFLDGFHDAHVLCVGDVMLDRFVYGRVDRVSAEAPIPILNVDSQRSMLGGVGNVARNVVALGTRAVLIAVTGDDRVAAEIIDLARSEELLTPRLIEETGRPTTVKTRYIADGQQLLRADAETAAPVSAETASRVLAAIRAELPRADVMILSEYTKGLLTDEVLAGAIAEARAAGVPVITDPKRDDFGAYSGVAVLKPNRAELAAATRLPCASDAEVVAAARKAMSDHQIDAMMVSRSEQGMTLLQRDAEPLHLAAKALEVFDVSGAGDTVVATTAVALAAGAELAIAAELGNVAGSIVVGKVGTAVISRDELASGLLAAEVSSSEAKVMSAEAAAVVVERWRERGQKIGFTNGCFDLLHPGHVSLLTEARASCDRLIVAMNNDKMVKRLKGEDRPVQHETARAIVLASLSMVDALIVLSNDTPVPLLETLRPDVLIKGARYTIDQVVGADLVRSYGGEVKLAAYIPGHSSTEVIAKISNGEAPSAPRTTAEPSTRENRREQAQFVS
jgi:D-beta-D-heptose 7-phosphate kinase/D-beta-D-heptose 1-phosphate adenosyltransferase